MILIGNFGAVLESRKSLEDEGIVRGFRGGGTALGNRSAGFSQCFESGAGQEQAFDGFTDALRQGVEDRQCVVGVSGFEQQARDLDSFFRRSIFGQAVRFGEGVLLAALR